MGTSGQRDLANNPKTSVLPADFGVCHDEENLSGYLCFALSVKLGGALEVWKALEASSNCKEAAVWNLPSWEQCLVGHTEINISFPCISGGNHCQAKVN